MRGGMETRDLMADYRQRYGETMTLSQIMRVLYGEASRNYDGARKFVREYQIRKGSIGGKRPRYFTPDVARALSYNMNE